jgi:RNA polymerase sigma factor (sigma-70 family)
MRSIVATTLDNAELEALLVRCAAQDEAALQALYSRTAPQILGILMRILGSRAAAEDALQDTFIRIWQQARQFDRFKGRALSWMVTIARNRAFDLQRAKRPTVLLDAAELSGAEQLQVEGPADRSEFTATHAALRRCLGSLGALERQCLVLAYQHGLTQDRIAASLSRPLGSVKSWMRRGLQSLKSCLES